MPLNQNTIKYITGENYIFWIALGFIGLLSLLGIYAFISIFIKSGQIRRMHSQITAQETNSIKLTNQLKSQNDISNVNIKRGPQGPPGVNGPPGSTGGIHAGAGPLLCVGQKQVATPTFGTKEPSIIYLDDKQYTPIQYWTMQNNSDSTVSIINKHTGNCMTTNSLGDIYSDTCSIPPTSNQKFNWMPNMQLSSVSQQNQCITIDNFARNPSNSNTSYDLNTLSSKQGSNNGNVTKLLLKSCSSSQNLNQTWWIGN